MKTALTISRKKIFWLIFVLLLTVLIINSSVWCRTKLAGYYEAKKQYVKAAEVYNQILIKNSIKNRLSNKKFAEINFNLAGVYTELNLRNLAIESFARGSSRLEHSDLTTYYDIERLKDKKLFAIGLLEAGRLDEAIKEFKKLGQSQYDFIDVEKYINTAASFKNRDISDSGKVFYFSLGDVYIENELFIEARAFFTKRILDYGVASLEVLEYLYSNYYDKPDIVEKVWGDNIYVTLEDFETLEPKLHQWFTHAKLEIIEHSICKEFAYRGKRSEALNVRYLEKGSDWWTKVVRIPLNFKNFKLGIRLYIYTEDQSLCDLYINIDFPEAGVTGVYTGYSNRLVSNGWYEYSIKDIAAGAASIAQPRGWNQDNAVVNKIIINTRGKSGQFLIDEIDLFLEKAA